MPSVDLSSRTFGKVYVLCQAPSREAGSGRKQTQWFCLCDCGTIVSVSSNNLSSGNSNSCGCLKRVPHRRLNLIGKRFGRLVVTSYSRTTERGQAVWHCGCDCGRTSEVRATRLLRGKTTSCGCYRSEGRFHSGIGPRKWATIVKSHGVCLRCGQTEKLEAHHIIPVSSNKKLARTIFNGACLCSSCHKAFHRAYGKETATLEDFSAFLPIGKRETSALSELIFSPGPAGLISAIEELKMLLAESYAS